MIAKQGLAAFLASALAAPAAAQMSAASEAAFRTGAGASAASLKTVIAQFAGVATAFFIVWALFGAFEGWAKARLSFHEVLSTGLRVSLAAIFIGFFIRP